MHKQNEKSEEKNSQEIAVKDRVLEDVLLELTQDSTEVWLSQVIIQYFKLNSKLDEQAIQVLEITIFFVKNFFLIIKIKNNFFLKLVKRFVEWKYDEYRNYWIH